MTKYLFVLLFLLIGCGDDQREIRSNRLACEMNDWCKYEIMAGYTFYDRYNIAETVEQTNEFTKYYIYRNNTYVTVKKGIIVSVWKKTNF